MSQSFDVLVAGGGVVGLTAGLAMILRGFSVAIVDADKMPANAATPDQRVYAINQASQNLLQELGVWAILDKKRVSPYRQMYVWDAASGAHIQFDARMIASDQLGTIIEESILKQGLLQLLKSKKGAFFANHRVTAVESADDCVKIYAGPTRWQARLLMIADGGHSPCRQILKVPLTTWPYHQKALITQVSIEKSHHQTAYQVFNSDGTLAFLPLKDENQCSIVWSTTAAHAKKLMELSREEFSLNLERAFTSKLGKIKMIDQRNQFPLIMRHTQQYTGSRWLLLGDAAHTIHPLAGLGLNVGLADVAAWLACLDKANDLTSKKALSAYQRQRKHAVWQIIAMMGGLKTLFTNPLPPVITLRGLGLRMCNNLNPIKRMLIEQAAGFSSFSPFGISV